MFCHPVIWASYWFCKYVFLSKTCQIANWEYLCNFKQLKSASKKNLLLVDDCLQIQLESIRNFVSGNTSQLERTSFSELKSGYFSHSCQKYENPVFYHNCGSWDSLVLHLILNDTFLPRWLMGFMVLMANADIIHLVFPSRGPGLYGYERFWQKMVWFACGSV